MTAAEETIPTDLTASTGSTAADDGASTARTLTLDEFVREQEELERAAAEAFADDEDGMCTYGDGSWPHSTRRQESDIGLKYRHRSMRHFRRAGSPIKRQAVYVCLTCTPAGCGRRAGLCFGCSVRCHGDHDIIELFQKRDFVCDCGNANFNGAEVR